MMQWIISSGMLIAVVIALRFALRGKISLRLQYALWLPVLVRLLIPMSFGTSDLSVMNAVPERLPSIQQSVTIPTENVVTPAAPFVPAQGIDAPLPSDFVQNTTVTDTAPNAEKTDWAGIARTGWLSGVAVLGLTFLVSNLRFGRKLHRSRRRIENTDASLPVYESVETETPCLFGLIKPSIYVTPDTCADADTLRYALAHEQTHYRHGDHLWAVLRGVCLALHWYNPLVWWAAELSRRDAELACDEATIHALGETERAAYGRTLIRMTCEQRPALLVTATMMTDSGKGLRERITLLVKKPKTAVCTAVAVLLIACLSVACTFTGGKDNVELTDPFGREYETAEIVGCSPYYTDFADMQMGTLALAKINAEGTRTVTLSNDGRCEYETVTEVTLTREDFDVRFKSKTDGPTAWLDKSLSAEKLRRNNAKAWFCISTAAGESGWANRVYLLQQKDGTLYLVMAEEQEPSESYPDGRNYVCFVHRLTERPMPVYDSMEDYALAQIEAIRENGIPYYVRGKDDFLEEFFDTVEDVRVMELYRLGELSDFAPDGTLELWRFSAEAKPSNKENRVIELVGGQNLSDDGYFSDGYSTYLVMMHKDDGYHTLRSFHSNDGGEVGRYPTVGAYLHDAYCDVSGFPGPYNLLDSLFRYTDGYGREVSDDGILTRGDGWYFYLPSGAAWVRNGGIHNLWYSAYNTESTITVNAFDTTVEETAASLISDGWTKETSGALTVYRRCCPSLPQSLIPSFDAYESVYLYERPEGGHYEVLTVWYDRDGEVNEWGWSPKAQVAAERQQLETMVRSFTVVPANTQKNVLALADLDGDGEAEELICEETSPQEVYRLFLQDDNGSELWSAELGLPHVGWNSYLLYRDGETEAILQYSPAMFQGECSYSYELFRFANGRKTVLKSNTVSFDTNPDSKDPWPSEAQSFADDVNSLLEKSTLLISTLDGELHLAGETDFALRCKSPNTSTPEFIHDIGRTLSELKKEYPEGEFIVKPDGFPGHAAVCFGVPKAEYLYYFFGTQSGDAEKAMNECEDRLKCAGFLTTTNVLFPEMKDDMGFEDFFSLIGVEDYEYFGEDTITAEGWLRFTYNDMEVMVNTNEPSSGGGWNVTGAEIVRSNAPASIVDTQILNANQDLAEQVMFD